MHLELLSEEGGPTQPDSPIRSPIPDESWTLLARRLALSPREIEVARGVLLDEKEFAIALRLGISVHTVHTHLERMYRKLGVSSRLQLAVELFRHSLPCSAGDAPPDCPLRTGA
jgi:DNA-binding CsgD family transcriptional regulator